MPTSWHKIELFRIFKKESITPTMEGGASMAYFFPGMKKIASRELLEPLWKECDEQSNQK